MKILPFVTKSILSAEHPNLAGTILPFCGPSVVVLNLDLVYRQFRGVTEINCTRLEGPTRSLKVESTNNGDFYPWESMTVLMLHQEVSTLLLTVLLIVGLSIAHKKPSNPSMVSNGNDIRLIA